MKKGLTLLTAVLMGWVILALMQNIWAQQKITSVDCEVVFAAFICTTIIVRWSRKIMFTVILLIGSIGCLAGFILAKQQPIFLSLDRTVGPSLGLGPGTVAVLMTFIVVVTVVSAFNMCVDDIGSMLKVMSPVRFKHRFVAWVLVPVATFSLGGFIAAKNGVHIAALLPFTTKNSLEIERVIAYAKKQQQQFERERQLASKPAAPKAVPVVMKAPSVDSAPRSKSTTKQVAYSPAKPLERESEQVWYATAPVYEEQRTTESSGSTDGWYAADNDSGLPLSPLLPALGNDNGFEREWINALMEFEDYSLAQGTKSASSLEQDKLRPDVMQVGFGVTKGEIFDAVTHGLLPEGAALPTYMTRLESVAWMENITLPTYRKVVASVVKVPLNRKQEFALMMFAHNLGVGNLKQLVEQDGRLNSGNYACIGELMRLYVNAGTQKDVPGLIRRRAYEADLWESGTPAPEPVDGTLAQR